MAYEHIIYETDEKIARIIFNNPEKMNAIHWPMSTEISAALRAAEEDAGISVIILKGAGMGNLIKDIYNQNPTILVEGKYNVEDAIRDLCHAFREGKLPNSLDDDKYFNVRTMKKIGAS